MSWTAEELACMQQCDTPDHISAMLTPDRKLYLGNLLKCYEFSDANAAIGSEVAHVLVQSPEAQAQAQAEAAR